MVVDFAKLEAQVCAVGQTSLEIQTSTADVSMVSALTTDSFPDIGVPGRLRLARGTSLGSLSERTPRRGVSLQYGRKKETLVLGSAYWRVRMPHAPSEVVILHGKSGTGKTTFVESLRDTVLSSHGYFVTGKYDQLRAEPYAAICAALTDVMDLISQSNEAQTKREALLRDLGEDLPILKKLISGVSTFLAVEAGSLEDANRGMFQEDENEEEEEDMISTAWADESVEDSSINTAQALKGCCRTLVRSLSSPNHPIVLFLDDLQWSQPACREWIQNITTDPDSENVLFVCAFRDADPESDELHSLFQNLQDLSKPMSSKQGIRCCPPTHRMNKIELKNLSLSDLNLMMSDVLDSNPSKTLPLSEVVFSKTHGNPFFVCQYLDLLRYEGLLSFPDDDKMRSSVASWELGRIREETNISDNVLPMIACKVRKLPRNAQAVLSVAAFLGFEFSPNLLEAIIQKAIAFISENIAQGASQVQQGIFLQLLGVDTDELEEVLTLALREGLVEQILRPKRFKFSHNHVQECLYKLVEEETEGQVLHLLIGHEMMRRASVAAACKDDASQNLLFKAVDHLNRGSQRIGNKDELVQLAQSNLKVARLAMAKGAFAAAAGHLSKGIDLLDPESMWKSHLRLSIELCISLAKMKYIAGDFDESHCLINLVMKHTKEFDDKFRACGIAIDVLFAQCKTDDAIKAVVWLLALMDEEVPRKPTRSKIQQEKSAVIRLLRGKSHDDICNHQAMAGKQTLKIAKLYGILSNCAFFCYGDNRKLGILCSLRLLRLSLKNGNSIFSPSAFSSYGIMLMNASSNNLDCAFKFGQLALRLDKTLQGRGAPRDRQPHCECVVSAHCMLMHWKQPIRSSLKALEDAKNSSWLNGSIENAATAEYNLVVARLLSGIPLQDIEESLKKFSKQIQDCRQEKALLFVLPLRQAVHNLMGFSEQMTVLDGDVMKESEFMKKINRADHAYRTIALAILKEVKFVLAVFFGKHRQAKEMLSSMKNDRLKLLFPGHLHEHSSDLFDGLTHSQMVREKYPDKNSHSRELNKIVSKLRKLVGQGCVNAKLNLLFLEAEVLMHKFHPSDDKKAVVGAFDKVILAAEKSEMKHVAALANEQVGLWLADRLGKKSVAESYIQNAIDLYEDWGAHAVSEQLEQKMEIRLTSRRPLSNRSASIAPEEDHPMMGRRGQSQRW